MREPATLGGPNSSDPFIEMAPSFAITTSVLLFLLSALTGKVGECARPKKTDFHPNFLSRESDE